MLRDKYHLHSQILEFEMIEEMEENNPKGISGTSEFEMIEETEENKSRGRSEAQWPALWRFGSCRREGIN